MKKLVISLIGFIIITGAYAESPFGSLNPNNPFSEVSSPFGAFNPDNPFSEGDLSILGIPGLGN